MLPLAGIRIIDLTTVAMGPLASQWLGDFGADVIKIEAPGGDSTRHTGPATEAGMAAMFLSVNRNKRSVVLDLKRAADRTALLSLVDGADVFMHNVRPQKLARLGITPEALMQRNPRLIYAGLHGFGAAGPYGGQPAYDDIIQGMSGCVDLMHRQTGTPRYFPTIAADKTTGLIAAMAILAAIAGRSRNGRGTVVEVPMFECMAGFNLVEHLYGRTFAPPQGETGYPRVLAQHRRPYRTRDGHICMMPYTDAQWQAFFAAAGADNAARDPRFASMAARTDNIDALYALVAELLAAETSAHWLAQCARIGVPASAVQSLDSLLHDPHLEQVDFFATLDDPALGQIRLPGVPVLFDGERPPVAMPPRLGQHNAELLPQGPRSGKSGDAAGAGDAPA